MASGVESGPRRISACARYTWSMAVFLTTVVWFGTLGSFVALEGGSVPGLRWENGDWAPYPNYESLILPLPLPAIDPAAWTAGFGLPSWLAKAVWNLLSFFIAFAAPHSLLAQPWAQRHVIQRLVPVQATRAMYHVLSVVSMVGWMAIYRRLDVEFWVWSAVADSPRGLALFCIVMLTVVVFSMTIPLYIKWDLFGFRRLAATVEECRELDEPSTTAELRTDGLYKLVRHPIYLATMLTCTASPLVMADRLLIAGMFATYLAVGVPIEERRLRRRFPKGSYEAYARTVPAYIPTLSSCARFVAQYAPGGKADKAE